MIYLDNNTFQQEIFIPRSSVKNDASPEYATKNELENAIENEVIRADEKYAAKTDLLPYATTGWVESQDFATKEWTGEQIQSAITSETERTEETYQKKSEMGIYSTTNEVENMIDDAVSDKMDTSAMSAYTPTSGFSTINGSAITSGGNIVVEATPYSAGTNIDITDHIISVTGITLPTKISELINDEGYITTADTQNFVTSGDVQTQINDSISGKADSSAVTAQISEVKAQIEAEIPSKVSDLENDLNFASTGDVESMISGFTTSVDVKTQIEGYNYINSEQAQTQIDNSISGKVDTNVFTAYTANTKTEIDNAVSVKADSSRVDEIEEVTASALVELHSTKQDILVSGTNIKTINSQSLLGSGNIEIQGGSSSDYSAGTNIDITNNVISVTGITIPTSNTAFTNDAGYVNSGEVETQIESKGYLTAYTETDPVFQASAASGITSQDISNWNAKLDSSALTPYYTSAQTDSAISNATSGKQDTLVSGTNIKTINNQSLLGSGNIEIQGGSGGSNIIEITQAEYDALTAYTEGAMYVITDAQEINMDNYATTGDIQTALGSYYTSAQTDTAISNAVSGKTDKISVTANDYDCIFPTWNEQGCITGTSATAYEARLHINSSSRTVYSDSYFPLPTIYAPTSAGSAGQPLLSNGSGAPVWGAYKFQFISQSEYDALATKDSTTIYFIVNEN